MSLGAIPFGTISNLPPKKQQLGFGLLCWKHDENMNQSPSRLGSTTWLARFKPLQNRQRTYPRHEVNRNVWFPQNITELYMISP